MPLGDLTRSPHTLSWASMNDEHVAARPDTSGEFGSGPTLTPVRRRGESHLLALLLVVAVIFVATAIAKPWGEGAQPGASAATTSLVAEITTPSSESAPLPETSAMTEPVGVEITTFSTESAPPPGASAATESMPTEADQPVFIFVDAGDSSVTYTVVCVQDPEVSPSVVGSGESAMGSRIVALACTSANLQQLESVLPSPTAP